MSLGFAHVAAVVHVTVVVQGVVVATGGAVGVVADTGVVVVLRHDGCCLPWVDYHHVGKILLLQQQNKLFTL